jgi:rhodanese-related sulfurtransferase
MPQQLQPGQVSEWLAADAPPLLLDVREPWEAGTARIARPEQRLIPMGEIPARLAELDPAQPIVVYCHHGMRSLQVVAFLERQGFESVYNLAGGIDAWSMEVDPSVPRY